MFSWVRFKTNINVERLYARVLLDSRKFEKQRSAQQPLEPLSSKVCHAVKQNLECNTQGLLSS